MAAIACATKRYPIHRWHRHRFISMAAVRIHACGMNTYDPDVPIQWHHEPGVDTSALLASIASLQIEPKSSTLMTDYRTDQP